MSQLIPMYIDRPFAQGGRAGEAQSCGCLYETHTRSVCVYIVATLQHANLKTVFGFFANLYTNHCVKIVRRHHLTPRWVLTLPLLGYDTNKHGRERRLSPEFPVHGCPSLAMAWFGLALVHLRKRQLICLAQDPKKETITLKADLFQMTRIHKRQMHLLLCHSVALLLFSARSLGQK